MDVLGQCRRDEGLQRRHADALEDASRNQGAIIWRRSAPEGRDEEEDGGDEVLWVASAVSNEATLTTHT